MKIARHSLKLTLLWCITCCAIPLALLSLLELSYVVPFALGTGMDKPDPNRPGHMMSAYRPAWQYVVLLAVVLVAWQMARLCIKEIRRSIAKVASGSLS